MTNKKAFTKKNSAALPASDAFIKQAVELVHSARQQVVRQTNSVMVYTYYQIGRLIVEHEQSGSSRAEYGKATILALSKRLSLEFGKGFSATNVEQMRSFYLAFAHKNIPSIPQTVSEESSNKKPQTVSEELTSIQKSQTVSGISVSPVFHLSWTHYVILSRMENAAERSFYEIESLVGNWSVREMQRQVDSGLYERLALSKDKKKVKELSVKGQVIERPEDVLKTPYI